MHLDHVARQDCPEEFKGVVNEDVDVASDIHAKHEHDLPCSFAYSYKCGSAINSISSSIMSYTEYKESSAGILQKGLKVGRDIIAQVSNEEKENNQDEDHFLAKIEEMVVKLEEDGTYSVTF